MNKKTLFVFWGVMFVLCAGLGLIPRTGKALDWVMTGMSLLFFLPPAVLLYRGDRDTRLLIRNLSALSLGITLVTLSLNFVLAVGSETLGNILHIVLTLVSVPMICSGYWALSLFLWACLLMAAQKLVRNK